VRQGLRGVPVQALEMVNILVIDDHPAKLLSYEVILEQTGATLVKASSACEAFESLLKIEFGLILIDVCMPDVDGFELAALIREHPRFKEIAIIFVSAVMDTESHRLRGYELGAVDYIPVPVMPELLRAKVNVFLELYRKTRQLKRNNAELEARVLERTAQLSSLNESLQRQIEERTREREGALARVLAARPIDTMGQPAEIAHDFSNLLMTILGSLTLLQRRVPDLEYRQLLHTATQATQRGAAVTRRLLAFARRRRLAPQSINISEVVGGIEELLKSALGPGIDLKYRFSRALPQIYADANRVELALLNVALNARSVLPDGGTLMMSASAEPRENDRIAAPLDVDEYVRIQMIHSDRMGNDATRAEVIEAPLTHEGAGLRMLRAIAVQCGGVLHIDSQRHARITLELCLPRADAGYRGGASASLQRSANSRHLGN
jgi:DNA-binding response OmpR family regulator